MDATGIDIAIGRRHCGVMPNERIVALIAKGLTEGVTHPGDPNRDQPPMPILLPAFRTAGMNEQQTELATKTATLLAEALVFAIEDEAQGNSVVLSRTGDGEVPVIAPMQPVSAPQSKTITVHCRCDHDRTQPLMYLNAPVGSSQVVIDGKQLLNGLHQRTAACPHGRAVN